MRYRRRRAAWVRPRRRKEPEIGTATSIEDAIAQARATPVVTIMPEYIETPEGTSIRIPAEAGYSGDLFPAADPPSM